VHYFETGGSGCRVDGSGMGFRVQRRRLESPAVFHPGGGGSGLGLGFRIKGLRFRVQGLGFRV
jgi:hypothetical protein